MVFWSPVSRSTSGFHPSICLAFVMSGDLRFGSSGGSGLKDILELLLVRFLMVLASSIIVVSFVFPMLMVSLIAFFVVAALRIPFIVSVT